MFAASLVACGGGAKKQAPVTPAKTSQAGPAASTTAPKVATASPTLGVDGDLAAKCKLQFANVEAAPKFAYDDTDLLPADRDILQQIANCLMRGPLQGRNVQLVGRADPRGTEEYNLGLGTRRAETVRSYLQRLGVPAARLSPATRGDLDASGTDETSFRRDRRVDLKLVN